MVAGVSKRHGKGYRVLLGHESLAAERSKSAYRIDGYS